jgi:F0F1-type ATP synthase delta subunit
LEKLSLKTYGKYGFVPFDININKIDQIKLEQYKKNQQLIKTKLKNTNIRNIIKSLHLPMSAKQQSIDVFFDENKNMTVQEFMFNMANNERYDNFTFL